MPSQGYASPPDAPGGRAGASASTVAKRGSRTSESPLQMPGAATLARIVWRTLRLRCPNCGEGRVLRWSGTVLPRCSVCTFRFERSDESYFSGAVFFGLLLGELIFAVSLLIVVWSMWPAVPWDLIKPVMTVGMIVVMVLMIPFSKLVWLGVDVAVRPVQAHELEEGPALSAM